MTWEGGKEERGIGESFDAVIGVGWRIEVKHVKLYTCREARLGVALIEL